MSIEPAPEGSSPEGADRPATRIIEWINRKIERFERELDELYELRTLLEQLELAPWPGEKVVKDITVADRKVALITRGIDYVRAVFDVPQKVPQEVEEYLRAVEERLRARDRESRARAAEKVNALRKQLQEKVRELEKQVKEELPTLDLVDGPDGTVFEIRFYNVKPEDKHVQEALELAVKASYLLKERKRDRREGYIEFVFDGDSNGKEH